MKNISIIIPISTDETAHHALLKNLEGLNAEIIISREESRAKSMNIGAQKSTRDYLWFLHADSHITQDNISVLQSAIEGNSTALHYFKLKFSQSGFITLNAIGANLRSKIFRLPFGDQGFCISKENFKMLNGFDEETPYGEDILFIRKAKQNNIKLHMLSSYLKTSARKYQNNGWFKTTLLHQRLLRNLMRQKI